MAEEQLIKEILEFNDELFEQAKEHLKDLVKSEEQKEYLIEQLITNFSDAKFNYVFDSILNERYVKYIIYKKNNILEKISFEMINNAQLDFNKISDQEQIEKFMLNMTDEQKYLFWTKDGHILTVLLGFKNKSLLKYLRHKHITTKILAHEYSPGQQLLSKLAHILEIHIQNFHAVRTLLMNIAKIFFLTFDEDHDIFTKEVFEFKDNSGHNGLYYYLLLDNIYRQLTKNDIEQNGEIRLNLDNAFYALVDQKIIDRFGIDVIGKIYCLSMRRYLNDTDKDFAKEDFDKFNQFNNIMLKSNNYLGFINDIQWMWKFNRFIIQFMNEEFLLKQDKNGNPVAWHLIRNEGNIYNIELFLKKISELTIFDKIKNVTDPIKNPIYSEVCEYCKVEHPNFIPMSDIFKSEYKDKYPMCNSFFTVEKNKLFEINDDGYFCFGRSPYLSYLIKNDELSIDELNIKDMYGNKLSHYAFFHEEKYKNLVFEDDIFNIFELFASEMSFLRLIDYITMDNVDKFVDIAVKLLVSKKERNRIKRVKGNILECYIPENNDSFELVDIERNNKAKLFLSSPKLAQKILSNSNISDDQKIDFFFGLINKGLDKEEYLMIENETNPVPFYWILLNNLDKDKNSEFFDKYPIKEKYLVNSVSVNYFGVQVFNRLMHPEIFMLMETPHLMSQHPVMMSLLDELNQFNDFKEFLLNHKTSKGRGRYTIHYAINVLSFVLMELYFGKDKIKEKLIVTADNGNNFLHYLFRSNEPLILPMIKYLKDNYFGEYNDMLHQENKLKQTPLHVLNINNTPLFSKLFEKEPYAYEDLIECDVYGNPMIFYMAEKNPKYVIKLLKTDKIPKDIINARNYDDETIIKFVKDNELLEELLEIEDFDWNLFVISNHKGVKNLVSDLNKLNLFTVIKSNPPKWIETIFLTKDGLLDFLKDDFQTRKRFSKLNNHRVFESVLFGRIGIDFAIDYPDEYLELKKMIEENHEEFKIKQYEKELIENIMNKQPYIVYKLLTGNSQNFIETKNLIASEIDAKCSMKEIIKKFNENPLYKCKLEKTENEEEQCPICYSNKSNIKLNCDHEACIACLRSINNNQCPMCRAKFDIRSVSTI